MGTVVRVLSDLSPVKNYKLYHDHPHVFFELRKCPRLCLVAIVGKEGKGNKEGGSRRDAIILLGVWLSGGNWRESRL